MVNIFRPPPSVVASWPKPNYTNPETQGPGLVVVGIILIIMGISIVTTRLFARIFITRALGIDDILIVLAAICATTFTILCIIANLDLYTGVHIWDLHPSSYVPHRINLWVSELCIILSLSFTKISVLLFYRRLSVSFSRGFFIAVWVGIIYNILFAISFLLAICLMCRPIEAWWLNFDPVWVAEHAHSVTCGKERVMEPISGILSSVSDTYTALLPMILISRLDLPSKQKIRTRVLASAVDKENIHTPKASRLSISSPAALDRLVRPFKCPGSANARGRASGEPPRKRRKVNYSEDASAQTEDTSGGFSIDGDSVSLKDKFPVFKAKDKDTVFRQAFTIPLVNKNAYDPARPAPSLGMRRGLPFVNKPLHDPSGEFAIVLYDPTIDEAIDPAALEEQAKTKTEAAEAAKKKLDEPLMHKSLAEILGIKKDVEGERPKVPVVIDPRLAKVLRPHQVEGVKFLYKCTTGMIEERAKGCIMADEMGLGKTLQCITLMWTLLKQSPMAGKGTIQKCVIACPASLVKNWANELVKWLGPNAINPFAVDGKATKEELTSQLKQWAIVSGRQVTRPVLIVSYESLRLNIDELKDVKIGLMLCDEGHRLKNADSNTYLALTGLNVERRVILSGTPIQNDLTEYFSLLDFANPGYLGTRVDFRKRFELPILRGRDAAGSVQDREKGEAATKELGETVNKFIIRRTNDILSKYLPIKYEHVVFCNLAPFQLDLYNHFIRSPDIKSLLKGKGSQPLKAIGILKKLCNHPDLLDLEADLPGSENCWPDDYAPKSGRGRDRDVKCWWSGKFMVLERMLARIRQDTNDKIVLISNYTQTLDVLESLCRVRRYGCLRLDGTMNVNKRQKLVDKFNDPEGDEFVFLLSSKAGGCGINLIGANRLILFDPDWNPAADQQALARVWRDGQKKDCFVYRFMGTGTIEEKIFQRQSHKQALSSTVVDSNEEVERHFTLESLRELFQFKPDTNSDTHDTFKCKRCTPDGAQTIKAPAMLYGDTSSWNHFVNRGDGTGQLSKIQDLLLRQEASEGVAVTLPPHQPIMDQSVQRLLADKLYDKRKQGALELERVIREASASKDHDKISKIVDQLCQDFAYTVYHPHTRNGGLIGLAAVSIALGSDGVPRYLSEIVPPVLACFTDQDARVRYYACEAMYNIAKVAKGEILLFFNDIFDALCKLAADSELSVKNGAELLDRLVKDIVSESAASYVSILAFDERAEKESLSEELSAELPTAFSLAKFIPLLEERIHVINPFTRTFLVSWLTLLDTIPDLELVYYLPAFLGGLFKFLGDPSRDVVVATQGLLERFLNEIKKIAKIKRGIAESRTRSRAIRSRRPESAAGSATAADTASSDNAIEDSDMGTGYDDINDADGGWIPGQDVQVDHAKILDILLKFVDVSSTKDPSPTFRLEGLSKQKEEEIGIVALRWIDSFFEVSPEDILQFVPRLLSQVLPALSAQSEQVRTTAARVNRSLMNYIVSLQNDSEGADGLVLPPSSAPARGSSQDISQKTSPEQAATSAESLQVPQQEPVDDRSSVVLSPQPVTDLDYAAAVNALTLQFLNEHEETRAAALSWLIMLHRKAPKKVLAFNDGTFPALLKTLSDPAEAVVTRDLQLLSQISKNSEDNYFTSFMIALLQLFSTDRRLLEIRGNLIIRQLCINLQPERIFRTLADCLEKDEDIEFASIMVQNLNNNLITAPELSELRKRLRNLDSRDGQMFFVALFRAWCHNAVASFSLCLLAQAYEQAYSLLQIFADLEMTVNMLIQIDKLVQLLENLRLQLLEPDRYPYLYKCLYGLLMLLPQSSAFAALKNRLNSVSAIGLLHTPAALPTGMANANLPTPSTSTVPGRLGRANRDITSGTVAGSDVKWPELLEKFRATQEKARRRHERALRGGGVNEVDDPENDLGSSGTSRGLLEYDGASGRRAHGSGQGRNALGLDYGGASGGQGQTQGPGLAQSRSGPSFAKQNPSSGGGIPVRVSGAVGGGPGGTSTASSGPTDKGHRSKNSLTTNLGKMIGRGSSREGKEREKDKDSSKDRDKDKKDAAAGGGKK
ncbi:hypothetical protein DV736_g5229, partial [Chaetothyriales sp. CBS 134916]